MKSHPLDPTFYAIIGTRRPDLLSFDDIKVVSEAFLASMEPAPAPVPNVMKNVNKLLNGDGVKKRRRGKGKRAKHVKAHAA